MANSANECSAIKKSQTMNFHAYHCDFRMLSLKSFCYQMKSKDTISDGTAQKYLVLLCPNFEKVGSILVSVHPCFVHPCFMLPSVPKYLKLGF